MHTSLFFVGLSFSFLLSLLFFSFFSFLSSPFFLFLSFLSFIKKKHLATLGVFIFSEPIIRSRSSHGKPAMFKISLHNILSFIRISYTDTQRTHTHQQLYANQRLPAHNLFFFYLVCTQSKPLPLSLPSYTHQQDSFHFIFSLRFFIPNQNNNACFSKHKHD